MSISSWTEYHTNARKYPSMLLGHPSMNHLRNGVIAPLLFAVEKKAFLNIDHIQFDLSPNECRCVLKSGHLLAELDDLIDWHNTDALILPILDMQRKINTLDAEWVIAFRGANNYFAACFANLVLARKGTMAIRNRDGMWKQSFQDGWLVGPPVLTNDVPEDIGLIIYSEFDPEYFADLPFVETAARAAIPKHLSSNVTIDWYSDGIPPTAG